MSDKTHIKSARIDEGRVLARFNQFLIRLHDTAMVLVLVLDPQERILEVRLIKEGGAHLVDDGSARATSLVRKHVDELGHRSTGTTETKGGHIPLISEMDSLGNPQILDLG
jgi:hypothetical protein